MSILTYNISVSNRNELSTLKVPFQIMPSGHTSAILTDKVIETYNKGDNKDIIIHVSYVTRPFGESSSHPDSWIKDMLLGYVKLAKKMGTRNILIHSPSSKSEFMKSAAGIKLIADTLFKYDMRLQLEIPAWSKDFISTFNIRERKPIEYMSGYIDGYIKLLSAITDEDNYRIVFDTAHLWSNGCNVDDMIEIMNKYKHLIEFIHLNGNARPKYVQDTHAPLFSPYNVIPDWEKLAKYCAELNVICVIEQTKISASTSEYSRFAEEYGFKLVL